MNWPSEQLRERIDAALGCASDIDGAHHKQWVIDQMVRALTGEDYERWVVDYKSCGNTDCVYHHGGDAPGTEDCEGGYEWGEGIAP